MSPGMTNEWIGGPRSVSRMVENLPLKIFWSSQPIRVKATHMLSSFITLKKYNLFRILCTVQRLQKTRIPTEPYIKIVIKIYLGTWKTIGKGSRGIQKRFVVFRKFKGIKYKKSLHYKGWFDIKWDSKSVSQDQRRCFVFVAEKINYKKIKIYTFFFKEENKRRKKNIIK